MLFSIATIISVASAATTLLEIPQNRILNGEILEGEKATIDLGVIVDVLGVLGCSSSQLIGLDVTLVVPNLLQPTALPLLAVCACVEVIPTAGRQACPQCPQFSTAICASATCGCACQEGFVASAAGNCEPISIPAGQCSTVDNLVDNGAGGCQCAPGFTLVNGRCSLAPSAAARRAKKSLLHTRKVICPVAIEDACPLPSGGYECVNTAEALDSCGGCVPKSGQNCLQIPGALGVACSKGACIISSCFPGWVYKNNTCVRA